MCHGGFRNIAEVEPRNYKWDSKVKTKENI